jgi:hypothetical protein
MLFKVIQVGDWYYVASDALRIVHSTHRTENEATLVCSELNGGN